MFLLPKGNKYIYETIISFFVKQIGKSSILKMKKNFRNPVITTLSKLTLLFILTSTVQIGCKQETRKKQTLINKQETKDMKTVLIIGMDPWTIDFTSPEIPAGLTPEKIELGTNATLEQLRAIGYDAETYLIKTGASDLSELATQLQETNYDGVVIGNGIRGLPSNFILFEKLVNLVHTNAPESKIIFNSLPTNTDEAVKRWL